MSRLQTTAPIIICVLRILILDEFAGNLCGEQHTSLIAKTVHHTLASIFAFAELHASIKAAFAMRVEMRVGDRGIVAFDAALLFLASRFGIVEM